jgi:hypothetical protein
MRFRTDYPRHLSADGFMKLAMLRDDGSIASKSFALFYDGVRKATHLWHQRRSDGY